MGRLFLGIDVSTTGAKALLIDEQGRVKASATTPLTLQTPKPLWSEQDPHAWWKGTAESIRKGLPTGWKQFRLPQDLKVEEEEPIGEAKGGSPKAPAGVAR